MVLNTLYEELKVIREGKNCDSVVIPGGMTSQLQPLEPSVNKPLKHYLMEEYKARLLSENFPLVSSTKTKRPYASYLAEWVLAAWKTITQKKDKKTVEQPLKKFCITNALVPR
jgi:hypothetical protein